MTDLIKFSKKIFTVGVVATTIFWSVGVAALVPGVANAAECPTLAPGDMIKVAGKPTIYVVNNDLKVLYFPTGDDFKSWRPTYGGYTTITQDCYDSLSVPATYPGAVNYRPGSFIVKRPSSDQLYVVEPNNTLAKITLEAAKALYGSDFAVKVGTNATTKEPMYKNLMVVNDRDWPHYVNRGTDITEAIAHPGMLVKVGTITYYVNADKTLSEVTETGMTANAFLTKFVRSLNAANVAGLSVSATISEEVKAITDKSQSGGVSSVVAPTAGSLTVSLSASTPTGATVPKSATNINVLKFNVSAGNTAATIDELTVKRNGAGLTTGLTAYLYDGETRLTTSGKSFSTDDNLATFSGVNLVVAANTTKELTVRLQTGTTAGEHSFSVTAIKLVGGGISAGLPVTGNTFSVSSAVTAGTLTVDGVGTLSNPVIGDTNVAVAEFKLTANSEDQNLSVITLKQDGTMPTSLLSNYKLMQGSTVLPVTASVSGRYVTLVLSTPLKLVNGSGKTFTLYADVNATADVSDTIVFYINTASDIKAIGLSYNYGATPDIDLYNGAGDSSTLTLLGGGVTISNKSASAHDVKVDSTSVELAKVGIKAVADTVEIQKMTLQLETTSSTADVSGVSYSHGLYKDAGTGDQYDSATDTLLIRNIKLIDADSGQTLGSAKAITDADSWADGNNTNATLTFTYTDYFTVNKGQTRNVAVVADINSAQVSGVVYKATLKFGSTVFTVKDSKDNTVTDVVPASNIASYNVTTRSSSLTVSRASSPESRTVVKGAIVDALGMIFTAGSGAGNDVKLSGLTLDTYVNASTTADVYYTLNTETESVATAANSLVTEVSLYVGGALIAGPATVDSNGRAIFTSSKFVGGYYNIPAGSNKTIVAKATVSGNAPYGSEDDAFAFTLDAADVTVEDANGTFTPTVTGTNLNGTTAPSVAITVTANGTITAAANSGKPDAAVVIAGLAAEQEVHRITLTATKEAFNVQKMTILVSSSAAYDDIEYIQLYSSTGTMLGPVGGVGLNSDGQAIFENLNFNVANTGETVVVVKAKFKAISERTTATDGSAGVDADSGDFVEVRLDTTDTYFKAVATSGFTDTQANAAVGNTMIVRKAKPSVTILALPSTSLSLGGNSAKVLLKFQVTATDGDIVLGAINPYFDFSDADGTDSWLRITSGTLYAYDVTGSEVQLNGVTDGYGRMSEAASSTDGQVLIPFDTNKVVTIAAGTTRTFEVRGDLAGVEASDSIDTKFIRDAGTLSAFTETFANAIADANNDFVWSDQSADTDAVTSVEWTNGYLLNLPTTASSVSKSS